MSINDLIHTNAHNAFEQGVKTERERIIQILDLHLPSSVDHDFVGCECEWPTNTWYSDHIIELIKGEQK